MATPFVGEIRLFAGIFAPEGWAFCDGSTIAISQNEVLYNLIGTTYGGDGVNNFNLPDLRSRVPVHQGSGYTLGQRGGVESVTLTGAQMPAHSHPLGATTANSATSPNGAVPGQTTLSQFNATLYGTGSTKPTTLTAQSILANSGGQPHTNIQPYQCITYIIALYGIYPTQG